MINDSLDTFVIGFY